MARGFVSEALEGLGGGMRQLAALTDLGSADTVHARREVLLADVVKNIPVEFELRPADLVIMGDAGVLEMALENVAVNAQIHGQATLVTIARRGDTVTIQDNGQGMTPEHAAAMWALTELSDEGSALEHMGLSLVRRIFEAHGGTIEFSSEPGDGATFVIRGLG